MMACCPFHNEKTPSFTVTPAKGIYKCFGCGKAGDAIQFVMDMEGLSFIESMKYLAKKYNIDIPEEAPSAEELAARNERESLFIALNFAKNYYQDLLWNNEDGQAIGYSYFKERGFTDPTIKKFELGFSLAEWDAFTKYALDKNFKPDILEKAGLIIARENANDKKNLKHFDRFRDRVIFPIHNITGKVIAFGARILKAEKSQPKYLNSPETEVYHKSSILYGIFQAKQAIRNEDNCFLVEGYTDVISLHQRGVENVVASSGTSLTEDQIKLIKRYTDNITVLYDGDTAGIKASLRGTDMILEQGMNVNVVVFPDGEDPDSYIRKIGGAEFKNYIKSAKKDFITFKTELVLKETGNDPIKKAEVIRDIVNSISVIPDPIKRAVFFKQCSKVLDIDEQTLISEYNKIVIKKNQDKKREPDPIPDFDTIEEIAISNEESEAEKGGVIIDEHERELVRVIVNYGNKMIDEFRRVYEYILDEVDDIELNAPVYQKLLEDLKLLKGSELAEDYFLKHPDSDIRKVSIDVSSHRYALSENWEKHRIFVAKEDESLIQLAFSAIVKLKWRKLQHLIRENNESLKKAVSEEEIETLQKVYIRLKESEKQLAVLLGNVISK